MGERKIGWQVVFESGHCLRKCAFVGLPQVQGLRICSDQQCGCDIRKQPNHFFMPKRGALRPRRQITTPAGAWKAETRRDNRDQAFIVELVSG